MKDDPALRNRNAGSIIFITFCNISTNILDKKKKKGSITFLVG